MKKSLLILFTLFAVSITAGAQKFALIDMEYILKIFLLTNVPMNNWNKPPDNGRVKSKRFPKKPRLCTRTISLRLLPFLKHKEAKRKKRLSLKRNRQPSYAANTSVRKANCIKNVKV